MGPVFGRFMENNLEAAIAYVFYLKIIQELNIVESNIIWVSVLENLETILEKLRN